MMSAESLPQIAAVQLYFTNARNLLHTQVHMLLYYTYEKNATLSVFKCFYPGLIFNYKCTFYSWIHIKTMNAAGAIRPKLRTCLF